MKREHRKGGLVAALLFAGTAAQAQVQQWDFQVFLDDKPIGYHRYTLREAGAERELTSEARFDVKLLFITAYRYAHDASESWRGNCLARLNARTDDNILGVGRVHAPVHLNQGG